MNQLNLFGMLALNGEVIPEGQFIPRRRKAVSGAIADMPEKTGHERIAKVKAVLKSRTHLLSRLSGRTGQRCSCIGSTDRS